MVFPIPEDVEAMVRIMLTTLEPIVSAEPALEACDFTGAYVLPVYNGIVYVVGELVKKYERGPDKSVFGAAFAKAVYNNAIKRRADRKDLTAEHPTGSIADTASTLLDPRKGMSFLVFPKATHEGVAALKAAKTFVLEVPHTRITVIHAHMCAVMQYPHSSLRHTHSGASISMNVGLHWTRRQRSWRRIWMA